MKRLAVTVCVFVGLFLANSAFPADIVPNEVQMPGTQPLEISNLESPDKCDNCHGGYNSAVEPAHNWRGSMMANAGRDPIFWATMAIAEQDFNGSGDLCLRCHSTAGWLGGRSTPTDGSGLAAGDSDGVECDYCHKLTNPDDSEHLGVMNAPFIANDGSGEGYYGSGMSSMWNGSDKLGPFVDAEARHQFMRSRFHRKSEFCGTCHDVSNPVTGDLAHNFGALLSEEAVTASGVPGDTMQTKAAFNNPPYRYGVVERTFSEHMSSMLHDMPVDTFENLPLELQGGALKAAYDAAYDPARGTANYEDGATRFYSCQSCHLRAVTGTGANKHGVPVRSDLPLHDMTGGNYWMADAIEYLDSQGALRLGGGLSAEQRQALDDGKLRALEQLRLAATLQVEGDTLKIVNHTGHKLISGYPEGRRMWLHVQWYDNNKNLLPREDGIYGDLDVTIDDVRTTVKTLLDPESDYTRVYAAHMGITPAWAGQLIDLGYAEDLALAYDRTTGDPTVTLNDAKSAGAAVESFHFALNNTVVRDNRIPPYGMDYDEARRRNASPIPADQYGGSEGGTYVHYDTFGLTPPTDAVAANIELMYQPTSWEYIQFLYLANERSNAFLAQEGANMLDAWLNTGMAEPVVIASTTWGATTGSCSLDAPALTTADAADKAVDLAWTGPAAADSYSLYYDQSTKAQLITQLDCANGDCSHFTDSNLTNGQSYCYKVTASADSCESGFSNILCATPQPPGQQVKTASISTGETGLWTVSGKGKNKVVAWTQTANFVAGDEIVLILSVSDAFGSPVSGLTVNVSVDGPSTVDLASTTTDPNGEAEVRWLTSAPKRNGQGGTPAGDYTAAVSGLNSSTYVWDGVGSEWSFHISN
ncbi:MAG: Ig-like domain-containing protein [Lysobacterales bacterium]|jgi:hypothetical protein